MSYLDRLFGLDGKVFIVTGSTSGLGKAMAEGLFRSGANVVINGRSQDRSQACVDEIYARGGQGGNLLAVKGDMSVVSDVETMVQLTISTFGKLDGIVNNAGINLPEDTFTNHTLDDWNNIAGVNMAGPLNLTRACLPYIKMSNAGRIINISSIGGHVGLPQNVMYTVTKGGMRLFTKSLAAELAETTITVNSISPGVMATPMNAKFEEETARQKVLQSIPANKMGSPEDLVGAVIYLASNASSYTTGTDLCVDGAYTAI